MVTSTPNTSILADGGGVTQHSQASNGSNNSSSARFQFSFQKQLLPRFDGKPQNFPQWHRHWRDVIAPQLDDISLVSLLDEYTPPEDNLKHCETPADAWKILTNKYANSTVVSAKLIHEYMLGSKQAGGPGAPVTGD